MSNPFREKLIPVPPSRPFEQSGGRQILYKGEMQSPNYVRGKKGWKISSDGDAEFQKIHIGSQLITLAPGDSLQAAIDELSLGDGGHIFLQAGTYTLNSTVNIKSAVQIIGENTSTTIIDFNNTSAQLKAAGTDAYTTGTIVAISNSVVLTGSGTAWLGNVTTAHQIFLGNKWYKIATVASDTMIILSEGYTGGATLPTTYRAVKVIKDIEIHDITLKNSTGTAIDLDDVRNVFLEDLEIVDNNKGFTMDNVSEIAIDNVIIPSNTSNGCEFNNCGFGDMEGLATPANGGHGVVLNNVRIMPFNNCASNANTGDGYNITSGDTVQLVVEASGNGGQGIEFVSGNIGCFIHNSVCETNTSDGIKLTATTDEVVISNSQILDNGGYGLNIAAATCDSNLANGCIFEENTSGAYNDSGTNTHIKSNVGATDKPASSASVTYKNGLDTSRAATAVSGTQNIAHGLGAVPNYVKITARAIKANSGCHSVGTYNGTTTACTSYKQNSPDELSNSTSSIVYLFSDSDTFQTATITVDATNIILEWTRGTDTTGDAGNIEIMWEAQS